MKAIFRTTVAALCVIMLTVSCRKERALYPPACEIYYARLVTGVTSATVVAGFSGEEITERGICYDAGSANPTVSGPKIKAGTGHGDAPIVLEGLNANTTYFIRAYAINRGGTNYSNVNSLTTREAPTVTIQSVLSVNTSSASVTVQVDFKNHPVAGVLGVCFSSSKVPDISSQKVESVAGSSNLLQFTLTGLDSSTTYNIRAFLQRPGEQVIYSPMRQVETFLGRVKDIDGNVYNAVKIGTQVWMVENLRTTRFRNGVTIGHIESSQWTSASPSLPFYGIYGNNVSNVPLYGRLYNFQAMSSVNGLAPEGWHVPSDEEWQTLLNFASEGFDGPGKHLCSSTAGWFSVNSDNKFGFSAVGGGMRDYYGYDTNFNTEAHFWSRTIVGNSARSLALSWSNNYFNSYYSNYNYGFSVRCIRD